MEAINREIAYGQVPPPKMSPTFISHTEFPNKEKIGENFYNFDDNENIPLPSRSPVNVKLAQRTNGFVTHESAFKTDRQSHSANKPLIKAPETVREKSVNLSESNERLGPEVRTFTSIGSANRTKDRELQMQLEVSQSRLQGLAKRIDACLISSKENYTDSKVMQPSLSSVESEKSSKSEIQGTKEAKSQKEVTSPQEAQQVVMPENTHVKTIERREVTETVKRASAMPKEPVTAEKKSEPTEQQDKRRNNLSKNKVETKPKEKVEAKPKDKVESKPKVEPKPKENVASKPQDKVEARPTARQGIKETPKPQPKSKEPLKNIVKPKISSPSPPSKDTPKDNRINNRFSPGPPSMDIQRQLETVSSVEIENSEEAVNQIKDFQAFNNSSSFAPSSMFKDLTARDSTTAREKVPKQSNVSPPSRAKDAEKSSNAQGHSSPSKPVANQNVRERIVSPKSSEKPSNLQEHSSRNAKERIVSHVKAKDSEEHSFLNKPERTPSPKQPVVNKNIKESVPSPVKAKSSERPSNLQKNSSPSKPVANQNVNPSKGKVTEKPSNLQEHSSSKKTERTPSPKQTVANQNIKDRVVSPVNAKSSQKPSNIQHASPNKPERLSSPKNALTNQNIKGGVVSHTKAKSSEKPSNLQEHSSPSKPVENQVKSPITDNRFSFSNAVETGSSAKKSNAGEHNNIANNKASPVKADKSKVSKLDNKEIRKRSEESGHLSKRTLNISNNYNRHDDRDLDDLMNQSEMSHPPMPQKLERFNPVSSRHSSKPDNQHHSLNAALEHPRKKVDLKLDSYLEEKFEMPNTISPVLNDRRSSRGTRDVFTPYNFDGPTMSMNELKNLSFDSSLLGKEVLSTKGNEKIREKSGFSQKTTEVKSQEIKSNDDFNTFKTPRSRALSQGKKEGSLHGEDLEGSFTKAYTYRKNKLVSDVGKFDERMQSDIYFRRRFQNDLNKFLEEYKPKITQEEAEMLYHRLAEDAKMREVKALKVQLQSERNYKPAESYNSIPEEQLNQTFERLVADARKRLFNQEEKEKLKILKEEEEERAQIKFSSRNKMSKEAEENMVDRFTAEAQRRRLKHEKQQRAKIEEEIRKANEFQNQGPKLNKNNYAKSKVREYIEAKPEKGTERNEKSYDKGKSKSLRNFYSDRKVKTTATEYTEEDEEETLTKLMEKNQSHNSKLASPKTRYLSIASPSNKVESNNLSPNKNFIKTNKSAIKGESMSSIEYLKHLREDISRHKTDIESHIQSINNYDIISPSQFKERNTVQQNRSDIKKLSFSGVHSPKNDELPLPSLPKVANKYKYVESKVAKQIEGKVEPSSDIKKRELKDTSVKKSLQALDKSGTKYTKTPGTDGKTSDRQRKTENEEYEKKIRGPQSKFMNALDAIQFVDKLINNFKANNKL